MATQIQLRRGTSSAWTSINPLLAEGEMGIETDTRKFKIGNGIDHWNDLSYGFSAVPAGGLTGQILAKQSDADSDAIWIDNYTQAEAEAYADAVAATAESNANSYTDSAISSEVSRADAAYDVSGAASSAIITAAGYTDSAISSEVSRADAAYAPIGSDATAETNAKDYADATFIPLTQKGATSGVASLDSSGKVPSSQLPAIAITDTNVVSSESAMLALTAQTGDVAIRTDLNKSFILKADPASTLANWQELLTPPSTVASVDGRTGTITLSDLYDASGSATTALNSAKTYADGVSATAQTNAITTSEAYTDAQIASYVPTQLHVYVKNQTGSTIAKGAAVYISGGTGANPLISLAKADIETTSSKTLGLTESSIANGAFGYVIIAGAVSNIDTSAAGADGDPVWLSPTTAGALVYGLANKPYAPNHMVFIGFVTRKSATVGVIDVRVQNGFELNEIHNVDLITSSPIDGDVLSYDSASGLWKNTAIVSGITTRTTATYTTASIANDVNETGTIALAKGYRLYKIQTSAPARVRLYTNTTGQTSDLSRTQLSGPLVIIPDGTGLVLDFVTTTTSAYDLNFIAGGFAPSAAVPITVTNKSGSSAAITVTLTYIKTEV